MAGTRRLDLTGPVIRDGLDVDADPQEPVGLLLGLCCGSARALR